MQELSARWHWACPLWNTQDAAHAVLSLRSCLPLPGRGSPLRRERVLWQLASLAWGIRCLPRLRRGPATGQLSVSFRIGQHPRRNDTGSGHDSEAFHHFCCADCWSRNCFSTDLTSSVLGPAPTPSLPLSLSASHVPFLEPFVLHCRARS